MAESEDKEIKTFVEDVNLFLDSQETILESLDDIYIAYLHGHDIREKITHLRNAFPEIYRLFIAVLTMSEKSDFVKKSKLSSEKRDKIFDLKRRYNGLKGMAVRLSKEADGRINSWSNTREGWSFDFNRNMPQIEFKIFSGDKQVFYTKDDIDDIYKLSYNMLRSVLASIVICQDKSLSLTPELIAELKKVTRDIEKMVKKTSEVIEKMEKSEEKEGNKIEE